MFFLFRCRRSGLRGRVDPYADSDLRQYNLRHRDGSRGFHGGVGDRKLYLRSNRGPWEK